MNKILFIIFISFLSCTKKPLNPENIKDYEFECIKDTLKSNKNLKLDSVVFKIKSKNKIESDNKKSEKSHSKSLLKIFKNIKILKNKKSPH